MAQLGLLVILSHVKCCPPLDAPFLGIRPSKAVRPGGILEVRPVAAMKILGALQHRKGLTQQTLQATFIKGTVAFWKHQAPHIQGSSRRRPQERIRFTSLEYSKLDSRCLEVVSGHPSDDSGLAQSVGREIFRLQAEADRDVY